MNCPVCNRPLKSKKSIAKGIGPVCEKKLEKLKNEPPDGQLSFAEETVMVIK
jgi:ssDNA-binding Zn-finger/Zn-ribbon topoisomerase 1